MNDLIFSKEKTRRERFVKFVSENVLTDEALKVIESDKKEALESNTEYQELKKALKKKEVEIVAPLVNKTIMHLAALRFARLCKDFSFFREDPQRLELMLCTEDGKVFRDGKEIYVATIAQLASYMDYFLRTLSKTAKVAIDRESEIYEQFRGYLDLGMTIKESYSVVCRKNKANYTKKNIREILVSQIQSKRVALSKERRAKAQSERVALSKERKAKADK